MTKLVFDKDRNLSLGTAVDTGTQKDQLQSMWGVSDQQSSISFGLAGSPIDVHALRGKKSLSEGVMLPASAGLGSSERISDANIWLPHAAAVYNISRRIEDYILVPVPCMFSSLPNTNGDSVQLNELLRFNPVHGRQSYKIWQGQPTFVEHDNQDYVKSKGVILDAFLRPLKKFGAGKYYKLVLLHAFDRTKDAPLVKRIMSGEVNSYSVGFYFKSYTCSICNFHASDRSGALCVHTAPKKRTYIHESGNLAYRSCFEIKPFESSSVGTPAFITAISNRILDPMRLGA